MFGCFCSNANLRDLTLCYASLRTSQAAGLTQLADWDVQREIDLRVSELQEALTEAITADPPIPAAEVLAIAKAKKVGPGAAPQHA